MECPEVWSFAEPEPFLHIEEFDNIPEKKFKNFPFAHLISVILPNTSKLDHTFAQAFCTEQQYYKVPKFDLSLLLFDTFLNGFVKSGQLVVMSIGTRVDCDNCFALTPERRLMIRLSKDTYEQLPLQGKLSHFTSKIGDFYVLNINLNDVSTKTSAENLRMALTSDQRFEVILSWKPPSDDICPSSIAKYIQGRGFRILSSMPKFEPHVVFTNMMPLFKSEFTSVSKDDRDSVAEFIEWLGMVSIDGDLREGAPESYTNTYEPPISCVLSEPTQVLQFRGLFMPEDVLKLVRHFKEFDSTEKKPWIAVYVQGFSDSPVGWHSEEHQFYLNGDNGYLLVFNEDKSLFVSFGCSKKRLK